MRELYYKHVQILVRMSMDPDHAYTLGCLIAGGRIGENRVNIKFPFKRWGKIGIDPARAAGILKSMAQHIQPKLKQLYGLDPYPEMMPEWQIICDGISAKLERDLLKYGITPRGILREHASVRKLIPEMDLLCKRDFVAAMADVIGSVAPSHRRFDMSHTIVSFEILGKNFNLVMELCRLLRDLGCPVDQILWEHPNMHSGEDPWYDGWIKKGNKLRVLTWDYVRNASFVFGSKVVAAERNLEIERKIIREEVKGRWKIQQVKNELCPHKRYQFKGAKTVHKHEFHERLKPTVRGHFIHYTHICAAMGCPFAPRRQLKIKLRAIENGELINPFVIYKFGDYDEIMRIVQSENILAKRKYAIKILPISKIAVEKDNSLLFRWAKDIGYRAGLIKDGLNEIVKANLGISRRKRLNGISNRTETLKLILRKYKDIVGKISFRIPELPTPIIVTDEKWGALIGPENPLVYKKLVRKVDFSNFRGVVIRPIDEKDLRLDERLA
jgi:hypothetical protein